MHNLTLLLGVQVSVLSWQDVIVCNIYDDAVSTLLLAILTYRRHLVMKSSTSFFPGHAEHVSHIDRRIQGAGENGMSGSAGFVASSSNRRIKTNSKIFKLNRELYHLNARRPVYCSPPDNLPRYPSADSLSFPPLPDLLITSLKHSSRGG
jgi:hypothetical protein